MIYGIWMVKINGLKEKWQKRHFQYMHFGLNIVCLSCIDPVFDVITIIAEPRRAPTRPAGIEDRGRGFKFMHISRTNCENNLEKM